MYHIDDVIEDFSVKAYHDDDFVDVKLSDYEGKWKILVFYPADFTFVCPTELGELADMYDQFVAEGAELFSVSCDTEFTHMAWHDASDTIKKIRFPMLADPCGKLSRLFGIHMEDAGMALRGSFIIDPDNKLKTIEIHHPDVGRTGKELLRKLKAAKFAREHGQVCPASWEPGEEGMNPGKDLVGKI